MEYARELAGHMRAVPRVITRRFFGGSAFVSDGLFFAFLMQGSLYLRVDQAGRAEAEALGAKPFVYAAKSRQLKVSSYYEAPSEVLEDPDLLSEWATRAHRAALAARAAPSAKRRKRQTVRRRR
jgi:TfoX/Sxy family transcriptional regulator of competence genes